MKFNVQTPPQYGWLEGELDKEHVDYLWKQIKNHKNKNHKYRLVGNISESYALEDENNYFQNEVIRPLATAYYQMSGNKHPMKNYHEVLRPEDYTLDLSTFWFNNQKKGEFNPYHDHGGVYSFVIWLKIPYDCSEEKKLDQFKGTKEVDIKAGCFEFEYYDIFGRISEYKFNLNPNFENTILFFPSMFRHCVYPFYSSDEIRVSVSGNLWLNTKNIEKESGKRVIF
tara:strand:+ start:805 stop:1482 length:678 start_codon:yes stop_codon:yes gene_type:complete